MSYSTAKKLFTCALSMLLIAGLLCTISCGKKAVTAEVTSLEDQSAADAAARANEKRLEEQRIREQKIQQEAVEKERFLNENILFAYDSSVLSDEAKAIIQAKADYLANHPDLSIIVQGHCDERGTTEYNLGLGERRAMTVKKYLQDLGTSAARITTVSYGEEMPLDPASTPEAWKKNRRAQFVIQ